MWNNYFLCICSRISVLDENTLLNLWGAAILFSKVITPSAPPPSWKTLIISDVSCALANPHCCLFCLPILVCLCSYDLFAGVLNATLTTVVPLGQLIRLPLAIFYEELRVKVPSLRTELGTFLDSSFSPLCPVLTTDSTDHGQAMEILVLCILLSHKWVGHTGLLPSAFLLLIIDPTGEDTLAICSSPLESPMALTVSSRDSIAWVLKRLPKYNI